jgi:hypothetical protein
MKSEVRFVIHFPSTGMFKIFVETLLEKLQPSGSEETG